MTVFVKGKKLTSDLSRAIRLEASREKTKEFFINECKWSPEQFDEVDWGLIDATLDKKQMATRFGYPNSTQYFAALDSNFPIEASVVSQVWTHRNSSSSLPVSK